MGYDWAEHREECHRLYIDEGRPLGEIMGRLREGGFSPSKRAFQAQFRRWGFPPKLNPVYADGALAARVRELWARGLPQREMLRVLGEEGFEVRERELVRLRGRLGLLLRDPRGDGREEGGAGDGDEHGEGTLGDGRDVVTPEDQPDETPENRSDGVTPEDQPDDTPESPTRASRKRRRRTRTQPGKPVDPGPPRFPSETTIDEARLILSLDAPAYRALRATFQRICEEENLVKKTLAGPERWDAAKARLAREMPQLQAPRDERSTTPEDAEAKYFRVLGAALSLVLGLLQTLGGEDTEKFEEGYCEFLREDVVWKCVNVGDPSVRKSACQLLERCLESRKPVLEEKMARLKKALISDGLKSNHVGSAVSFVKVLSSFTKAFPEIWRASPGDKKSPVSRLGPFVEKGSQGSQAGFWEGFEALVKNIPSEVLSLDAATALARSMRAGITGREEPRLHAATAWTSYLRVAKYLMGVLPSGSEKATFAEESLAPLIEHYLHPGTPGASPNWIVPGPAASAVAEGCYAITTESAPEVVVSASVDRWRRLAADYCGRIANSLPEVSREYQASQEAIAEEGARWFTLAGQVQRSKAGRATRLDGPAAEIVACCVGVLSRRNLKPFGAAKTVRHMAEATAYLGSDAKVTDAVFDFLFKSGSEQMGLVLKAQSRLDLVACLQAFAERATSQYEKLWKAWVAALLKESDEPAAPQVLGALLSHGKAAPLARGDGDVQDYVVKHCRDSLSSGSDDWGLLRQSLTYGALTTDARKTLAEHLLGLPQEDASATGRSLDALTIMARHGGDLLSEDEDLHLALATKLLSLSENDDAVVSSKASELRRLVDGHSEGKKPTLSIVQNNLETAGPESLEIDTLAHLATQELEANPGSLDDLLPDPSIWLKELSAASAAGVNPSLSITSSLGGAQFLVHAESPPTREPAPRDRSGRSVPARMALYMANLLEEKIKLESFSESEQSLTDIVTLLLVTSQMASDQLTLMEPGGFFDEMSPDNLLAVDSLVSSARRWIHRLVMESTGWESDGNSSSGRIICELLGVLMEKARGTSALAFYCARAASEIIQELTERHGPPPNFDERLSSSLPPKDEPTGIFPAVALLYGVGQSLDPPPSLNTLCNRLVSDVAGGPLNSARALAKHVLLTCCLNFYQEGEVPVQMNRLVLRDGGGSSACPTP